MENQGQKAFSLACHLARLLLLLINLNTAARAQVRVTLAWNPSPDPTVVGFRLYEGLASQTYTTVYDVSSATSVTLTNLAPGRTYYFAVTAYDVTGLESDFSGEIGYTAPVANTPGLQVSVNSSSQVVLSGTAAAEVTLDVLATEDLQSWVAIGTFTVGTNGWFEFTDPTATSATARFYRLTPTSRGAIPR